MIVLYALAAFGAAMTFHAIAVRVPMRVDVVKRFLMVGVPIGLGLIALVLARFGLALSSVAAILLYAFLCELYIFCFTLVLSSVSAILLVMLRAGPIEVSALAVVYDPDEMVRVRLDRLLSNDFVEKVHGRLAVTRKGMKFHRAFALLRRMFGHEP